MKFLRLIMSAMLVSLLNSVAFAELGVGTKCYITDPGRRAVEASKGYYDLYLKPGDSVQHVIEIENSGNEAGRFLVYPGDGFNTLAGALAGGPLGQQPVESGRWLAFEREQVVLAPKAKQRVAFKVTVPPDVGVGEYFSYVFVQPEPVDSPQSDPKAQIVPDEIQSGMKIRTRVGILVITFVGDTSLRKAAWQLETPDKKKPEESKSLGKVYDRGEILYRCRLRNTGNVFLKPKVLWALKNSQGQTVSECKEPAEVGYVCSGHPMEFNIPLSGGKLLARGPYRLAIKVSDSRYPDILLDEILEVTLP